MTCACFGGVLGRPFRGKSTMSGDTISRVEYPVDLRGCMVHVAEVISTVCRAQYMMIRLVIGGRW